MKKIFVIGSNSFSGSAFVKQALQQDYAVIGTSRSEEPEHCFLPHRWLSSAEQQRFQFFKMDLNHDLESLMQLIHEMKPAYVVNFAAQSMVAESWQHPEQWMMTNVVSTVKFHDQLRKCDFLEKYVHISTPEVYGSCAGLVPATTHYYPSTPYAVSRAASDMWLNAIHKNYQFPVVFTRAANVYGPGQQLYRIIPKTILTIKKKNKLPLHGGGHSVRSFIHIDDVADGTLKILTQGCAGNIYHFSTQKNISIRELVHLICQKMKATFEDVVSIVDERPGKDSAYLLDSTESIAQLGWKDRIALEEGIEQTIQWVDNHFTQLQHLPLDYQHKV